MADTMLVCVLSYPCRKSDTKLVDRKFMYFSRDDTVGQLIDRINLADTCSKTCVCAALETGPWTCVSADIRLTTLVDLFGCRFFKFECDCKCNLPASESIDISTAEPAVNAFNVLMGAAARQRQRKLPPKKVKSSGMKDGLNSKDALYNRLLDDCEERGVGFLSDSDGTYVIQTVVNCLWYLTSHHLTINDAASQRGELDPIPDAWSKYDGYNDFRRKKIKQNPLSSDLLKTHSDILLSVCLKPFMKCSPSMTQLCMDTHSLAQMCSKYAEYLDVSKARVQQCQEKDCPVRMLSEYTSVLYRAPYSQIKPQYNLLDRFVTDAGPMVPVYFDEAIHIENVFDNRTQRYRFFENLHLSVPVEIIKYSPGGSALTCYVFYQVEQNRPKELELSQATRMFALVQSQLPVFHTRLQKQQFKQKYSTLAKVTPSVMEAMYKDLTMDASEYSNPVVSERLRLGMLGETSLLADMRRFNSRPCGNYEDFFEKLAQIVDEVTAADDRRHGTAHMSEWISLRDLMEKTKDRCSPETPVPSKSLVRLQFTPTNSFTRTALRFTSRFQVQHKIQRRQLRSSHPDMHFCASLLCYLRHMSVMFRDKCALFFCDDKAKIPVGEPGHVLSTGVRGKKTLAPSTTTLVAEDHDVYKKCSLTPSVYLQSDVPIDAAKSFYGGNITVTVNDTITQQSSPFRHAATLLHILRSADTEPPPILLKFSDGGTDQRNTLISVKVSLIVLFKELNLSMLVAARCAPGQSFINTAERAMSLLNLALQNCALERKSLPEAMEKKISKANGSKDVREQVSDEAIRQEWRKGISEVASVVQGRFRRLSLKGKPVTVEDSIPDEAVNNLKQKASELFPDLNMSNLTKVGTKKSLSYHSWVQKHCKEDTYCFQIMKCDDHSCCKESSVSMETINWLPRPELDKSGEHYKKFEELYGTNQAWQEDVPSQKPSKGKKTKTIHVGTKLKQTKLTQSTPPSVSETNTTHSKSHMQPKCIFTAQHARTTVKCIECGKPRVIFSQHCLTFRQNMSLTILLSEFEYSCGGPVCPENHLLNSVVKVRTEMTCGDPIERAYYGANLGQLNICSFCGGSGEVDREKKTKFRVVLPICTECSKKESPICYMPITCK